MNLNLDNETTDSKPSFYFKKDKKLCLKREYELVFKNGHRFKGEYLCFVVLNDCQTTKIGIIARKKEFHEAVQRNKVKRRLRELARLNFPVLLDNVWLVIQTYPNVDKVAWKILHTDFLNLCQRAKLIKQI